MALLNIFKKKKEIKESKSEKPSEQRLQKTKKEAQVGLAWRVLKSPHITEKATNMAKQNQYVFKVPHMANKTEIKKALENLYNVNVLRVRIARTPEKKRRLGRTSGIRRGYKKAMARIKEGQKIEVLPR